MKRKNILWGLFLILAAILLILNTFNVNLGIPDNLPVWKILLAVALLFVVISEAIKKNFEAVFFPIVFIIMLFEGEIATLLNVEGGDLTSAWTFLLIAFLLTVGTSLLLKHGKFTFTVKNNDGEEVVFTGEEAKEKFREMKNSTSVYYVDCSEPINKDIEINMGSAEVFFTNAELYDGNGEISVDCNMAKVVFHIPADWIVDCDIDNNLGSLKMNKPSAFAEISKRIKITGENNLGKIEFIQE